MLARRLCRDALSLAIVAGLVAVALQGNASAGNVRPVLVKGAQLGRASLPRVGPGRGSGRRQLEPVLPRAAASRQAAQREAERTHKQGTPPKIPRATLPSDAPKGSVNERVRRSIAGGVTTSQLQAGQADPELSALRQADLRLFPPSLGMVDSSFDPELPRPVLHQGPNLSASGLPLATAGVPMGRAEPALAWPHGLNVPNLPVALEQRTLDYVKFYRDSEQGRAIAEAWARKAGRYVPAIQAELARAGLPTDLVWMSLVESGHNPTIRSPAGAAGLWQFIPESARFYGLVVDRWVDERLDPLRSTQAATVYLSDLHRRFGTWELAMAAYNMGHYGLTRAIRKYNTNDFWRLCRLESALPWETALYVPKVLATAIVMTNKRAFGLGDIPSDPAVSFDTVLVPAGVPLASIAARAGMPEDALASLNPQYLAARTPPASPGAANRLWAVHVPLGQGDAVTRGLAELVRLRPDYATYRIRVGDTLAGVAERLRGSEEELTLLNQLEPGEQLLPGSMLLVPPALQPVSDGGELVPREDSELAVVLPPMRFQYSDRERVYYRTLPGDTLDGLAEAFLVSPADLALWNSLDARAKLQSEMVLQVFVTRDAQLSGVRYARERNAGKRLEAGSPSFFSHFEAEQGRQRLQILARDGDTLHSIGRRYGLSDGTMERINHFSRTKRLAEGRSVIVYAKYGPVATEVLLSRAPDPLPPVDPPHPSALPVVPVD
jgi:membrane-bound lytic murein transglycosylase D